jgi:hypothetical protein
LKQGPASNRRYDFKDMNMSALAFVQTAVGASYPLFDKSVMVGAKVKVLTGIGAAGFNLDRFKFYFGEYEWLMESQATVQVYTPPGVEAIYDDDDKFIGFNADDMKFGVNGWGLGIDLGGTLDGTFFKELIPNMYDFLNNFSASVAITDIGFISWKNTATIGSDGEPITLLDGSALLDMSGGGEFFNTDTLINEIENSMIFRERPATKMKGMGLRAKLNWGIDYNFPDYPANVGFLSTTHFNPFKTFMELTLGGAIRPIPDTDGLELGASYSLVVGGFKQFGVSLHLGNFLFISSDYLIPTVNSSFIPVSVKGFNVQLGLAVPLVWPKESSKPKKNGNNNSRNIIRSLLPATTEPLPPDVTNPRTPGNTPETPPRN